MKIKNIKKSGFTFIETLVAISILLIAVVGPMSFASKSISFSFESRNKMIAFFLAQEGVEYIRKIRDDQAFLGEWMTNSFNFNWCTGGTCYIDTVNKNIANCGAGSCPAIKYDSVNGYYNYLTGDDTIFIRSIVITTPFSGNSDEARITVTVTWPRKLSSINNTIVLTEHVFNWKTP